MLKNGKITILNYVSIDDFCLLYRAFEVWGSPEMLNKEKMKRNKNRQQDYEGYLLSYHLDRNTKQFKEKLNFSCI